MPTLSSLPDIHMSVESAAMDSDECKEREKMHPTTEELRLLGEVSSLIGRGEHGECGLSVFCISGMVFVFVLSSLFDVT